MPTGQFWLVVIAVAVLTALGWKFLASWPYWVAVLWILALIGLVGYGFYQSVRAFFGKANNEPSDRG